MTKRMNLEKNVSAQLTFVSNKLSRGASATYRQLFGIGVTEWRVVVLLAIEPEVSAQRIAHVIGLDKALVSRTIKTLQDARYISVTLHETDNRVRLVKLTRSGTDLHDKIIKVALERERLLLEELDVKEIDYLLTLLKRLHDRVDVVNSYDQRITSTRGKVTGK